MEAQTDPEPSPTLRCKYLFAGAERSSDFEAALAQVWRELDLKGHFEVESIDLLRGGAGHDLSNALLRESHLAQIKDPIGAPDVVIVTPLCNGHSRAKFANRRCPPPTRSARWPRGYPWLEGKARAEAEMQNDLIDSSFDALEAAAESSSRLASTGSWRRVRALLEHPEDLGSPALGDPASIWQLSRARSLSDRGFGTGAVFACALADVDRTKPYRFMSDIPGVLDLLHLGWPSFVQTSTQERKYIGPLPRLCEHGGHPPLERQAHDKEFRTNGTA